jgi:hypothetical protein
MHLPCHGLRILLPKQEGVPHRSPHDVSPASIKWDIVIYSSHIYCCDVTHDCHQQQSYVVCGRTPITLVEIAAKEKLTSISHLSCCDEIKYCPVDENIFCYTETDNKAK